MQIVSATQFKTFNRGRNITRAAIGLRKQIIAPAELMSGDARELRFTISTDCVDREQDRIAIAGWDLANFRRNPVVLFVYLLKSAVHYHVHTMVHEMNVEQNRLVNSF